MFHQNIGVNDMNEFPALGTPSNNNLVLQRSYASTVQDPAYYTRPNDFPALTHHNQESSKIPQQTFKNPVEQTVVQTSPNKDNYDLLGLTKILRRIEPDRSMMVLGSNLPMLRLNLNTPHFFSPWSDKQKLPGYPIEPGYCIPFSYRHAKASPPANERISSFSDQALFYMFYSSPNDIIQDTAAKELFNRHWRYNKELKVWITKQINEQGNATDAIAPSSDTEKALHGYFIIFDPIEWKREKKELTIIWDKIQL